MVLLSSFVGSVEMYVMAAFLAAAVVGLCVRPRHHGAAVTSFAIGTLEPDGPVESPMLEAEVMDDCSVILRRSGFCDMGADSTVALAITRIGFDIKIQERITLEGPLMPHAAAQFRIEGLGRERYHITYSSEPTGLMTAFTLPVKPGIRVSRKF